MEWNGWLELSAHRRSLGPHRADDGCICLNLATNDEVLAVNQDALCKQGYRINNRQADFEIRGPELADGNKAVGLFNLSEQDQELTFSAQELGLTGTIRDLAPERYRHAYGHVFSQFQPARTVIAQNYLPPGTVGQSKNRAFEHCMFIAEAPLSLGDAQCFEKKI